jgi:hypothetical protein
MFENVTILLKNMKIYFVYASLQIFTLSDWLKDVTYGIYTHICECAVKHDIHRLGNICMGNRMPQKIIISLENITPDISRFRKVSAYCSVPKHAYVFSNLDTALLSSMKFTNYMKATS